jgi:hypothetical protein
MTLEDVLRLVLTIEPGHSVSDSHLLFRELQVRWMFVGDFDYWLITR